MNPDGTLSGGPSDWDPTATPVWATGNAPDTVPPAWPPDAQNQPQEPPQVPMSQLTSEADIFCELLRTVSLLGQDAVQTCVVLTQQTDTLHLLQSQVYQTSQDSAELTRCIADQAASTFCLVYSASSSGNASYIEYWLSSSSDCQSPQTPHVLGQG